MSLDTAVEVADVGKEARVYLTVWPGPVLINLRAAAFMALWVVYHRPLLWRIAAIGCNG